MKAVRINNDGYMNQPISKRRRPAPPEVGSSSMIPDEVLLLNILVRLPVKSLVRFKSVCKAWCATIASAHFARLHLELARATSPSSMVVVPRKYQSEPRKVASQFVHIYRFQPAVQSKVAKLIMMSKPRPEWGIPRFTIPLHCDGLVLIPSMTGHIFVCNPATKEFVELPPGTRNVSLDQRVTTTKRDINDLNLAITYNMWSSWGWSTLGKEVSRICDDQIMSRRYLAGFLVAKLYCLTTTYTYRGQRYD